MIPGLPDGPAEYTSWDEHVYASLRWAEGSIRRLHALLEHETVDDQLRAKVTSVISWIEASRLQAFHAFEKMGGCTGEMNQAALGVSSIGEETKVKVLELSAAYLESLLMRPEATKDHASLLRIIQDAIMMMKELASEISGRLKKNLDGPPESLS